MPAKLPEKHNIIYSGLVVNVYLWFLLDFFSIPRTCNPMQVINTLVA
jgi:hypothetical protein